MFEKNNLTLLLYLIRNQNTKNSVKIKNVKSKLKNF